MSQEDSPLYVLEWNQTAFPSTHMMDVQVSLLILPQDRISLNPPEGCSGKPYHPPQDRIPLHTPDGCSGKPYHPPPGQDSPPHS